MKADDVCERPIEKGIPEAEKYQLLFRTRDKRVVENAAGIIRARSNPYGPRFIGALVLPGIYEIWMHEEGKEQFEELKGIFRRL